MTQHPAMQVALLYSLASAEVQLRFVFSGSAAIGRVIRMGEAATTGRGRKGSGSAARPTTGEMTTADAWLS